MSVGSILKAIGHWFAKAFANIKKDAAPVAITITEYLKNAVDSGLLKTITDLIPGKMDDAVLEILKVALPKALAIELGLKGLPDNATPEQIQEFILSIEQAIGGKSWQQKSAFWTKYAVEVYSIIETQINNSPDHENLSFAQIVKIVQDAYEAYRQDLNGEPSE